MFPSRTIDLNSELRSCIESAQKSDSYPIERSLQRIRSNFTKDEIILELKVIQSTFPLPSGEVRIITDVFRTESDHPCSDLLDLAYMYTSRPLITFYNFLNIPTPDTSLVMCSSYDRLEIAMHHLITRIILSKNTVPCTQWMTENFTTGEVLDSLRNAYAMIYAVVSDDRVATGCQVGNRQRISRVATGHAVRHLRMRGRAKLAGEDGADA